MHVSNGLMILDLLKMKSELLDSNRIFRLIFALGFSLEQSLNN
jgi:hypothetical protein